MQLKAVATLDYLAALNLGLLPWLSIKDTGITDRLVKGLLGEQSLAIIAGPTGSAKTFLALDMGIHIVCGWEWFGRKVKRCGVLYLAAEGQNGVRKRIAAIRQHHGIDETADIAFAIYPGPVDLVTDNSGVEKVVTMIQALNALWRETPVGLVIPDTLARCFGDGDESATRDMNTFVTRCDTIRVQGRTAVLPVHHFGKDETKGMRGSIALKAAADTVIEVTGTEGTRTAKIEKQKDGEAGGTFAFKLKPVDLGQDEDGEAITSCIVEGADPTPANTNTGLTQNQQTMLAILNDAGKGGMTIEEWNEQAKIAGLGKRRHADLWDFRKALKARGLAYEYDGRWYPKK
jgi:AAA domain